MGRGWRSSKQVKQEKTFSRRVYSTQTLKVLMDFKLLRILIVSF